MSEQNRSTIHEDDMYSYGMIAPITYVENPNVRRGYNLVESMFAMMDMTHIFIPRNRGPTIGDMLDILVDHNMIEDELYDIAIQQSLDSYTHYEKKPIKLDVNNQEYKNTDKKFDSCSICKDDFIDVDIVTVLICHHYFHKKCISEWGKYKPECPNCKTSIKIKSVEEEKSTCESEDE